MIQAPPCDGSCPAVRNLAPARSPERAGALSSDWQALDSAANYNEAINAMRRDLLIRRAAATGDVGSGP